MVYDDKLILKRIMAVRDFGFVKVYEYLLEERQKYDQLEILDTEEYYAAKLETVENILIKMEEFLRNEIEKEENECFGSL